jgi:hypothetical protein
MTDFALILTCGITVATITAAWHALVYWLEHRDDCKHSWSTWGDPVKGDGHPYQLRACTKCNQWESRTIK